MQYFYEAYQKDVQGTKYFFVKRMLSFPEYPELSPLQEGFGMHTDFDKACRLAGIDDAATVMQIFASLSEQIPVAKIIDISALNDQVQSNAV